MPISINRIRAVSVTLDRYHYQYQEILQKRWAPQRDE
jgi:hypothetical protein